MTACQCSLSSPEAEVAAPAFLEFRGLRFRQHPNLSTQGRESWLVHCCNRAQKMAESVTNESNRELLLLYTSQMQIPLRTLSRARMRDRSQRMRIVDNSSPSAPANSKPCLKYDLCNKMKTIACLCTFFLQFWNATRLDHRLTDEACEPRHTINSNKITSLWRTTRRSDLLRYACNKSRSTAKQGGPSLVEKRARSLRSNWREAAASL